jgi:outer membrane autotransporter protein
MFAAVGISKLRAMSGSHVDTRGIGLNLGFARELENSRGKLLFGPVIEYGHGSYDSYQDNGIKADGNASYWGLGIIAKQTNSNGFYYEGSIRGGRVKSDYDSDLSAVTHASYDSSATYWAAHAGLGRLTDLGKNNTLDVYGKYFYSHTGGDSVTVHATAGDEDIRFSGVNSHRMRIGARFIHAINETNRIYGGLAYQYEFSGKARATYHGGSTPSPSVKGSSGMMELGWQVKPGKGPMAIDLGVTGWVGKQRGVTANLQASWTF